MNKKHLYFIGFPNAGKSFFGEKIATKRNVPYVDLDKAWVDWFEGNFKISHKIAVKSKLKKPYQWLHDYIYRKNIAKLKNISPSVINTGGATVYDERVMKEFRTYSLIIYLKAPYEVLAKRKDYSTKGLHIHSGMTYKEEYEYRLPLYERWAEYTIEDESDNWQNILKKIEEILKKEKILQNQ